MIEVDSAVLQRVNKALQLSSHRATGMTEFQDELLQQVLDVRGQILRGGAPLGLGGIFGVTLQNNHTGGPADIRTAILDVYTELRDAVGELALDVWICSFMVTSTDATAWGSDATLILKHTQPQILASAPGTFETMIMHWSTKVAAAGFEPLLIGRGGQVGAPKIPIRVPRDAVVWFSSESDAVGAESVTCTLTLGIFPEGMGQDVIAGL